MLDQLVLADPNAVAIVVIVVVIVIVVIIVVVVKITIPITISVCSIHETHNLDQNASEDCLGNFTRHQISRPT